MVGARKSPREETTYSNNNKGHTVSQLPLGGEAAITLRHLPPQSHDQLDQGCTHFFNIRATYKMTKAK